MATKHAGWPSLIPVFGIIFAACATSAVPEARQGGEAKGSLAPELIQKVVRDNFALMRACYELGLEKNPTLHGRIPVRFVIGRDGEVCQVSDDGSDLPDPEVVKCILGAFWELRFPVPRGGIVKVVYPIMLEVGDPR
jgi:hypothetical protein